MELADFKTNKSHMLVYGFFLVRLKSIAESLKLLKKTVLNDLIKIRGKHRIWMWRKNHWEKNRSWEKNHWFQFNRFNDIFSLFLMHVNRKWLHMFKWLMYCLPFACLWDTSTYNLQIYVYKNIFNYNYTQSTQCF